MNNNISDKSYNYLFKFIIVGDTFVGKSNLLSQYTTKRFNPEHEITIGCEFMAKNIIIKDRIIRIQIWDTAGQETFRAVTRNYYKNCACCIIVYDITNKKSFNNLQIWIKDISENCSKQVKIILVGNKKDLEEERQVDINESQEFAEKNEIKDFYETSALTGENVDKIFEESAKEIVDELEKGLLDWNNNDSGIKIMKWPDKEIEEKFGIKEKKCC